MKKIYSILFLALIALSSCQKEIFDMEVKGEAIQSFKLTAPADNAMLVLNSATPNAKVTIEWTAAKPGVSVAPTYKWIAALKTGSLDEPVLEIPSDNDGKATKLTLTQKAIDDALKALGVAEGVKTNLIWSVVADNGSVKLRATDQYNVAVTRFGDGLSNFVLYGPLPTTSVKEINPGSTTDFLTFKWQKSFAGKVANAVTYKIKFVKNGESFDTPLMQFNSNNSGSDSTFTISYKAMDEALTAAGLSDQGTAANLQWTVEAKSGTTTKFADYVNKFSIVREVKMFLVGSATPNEWNVEKAVQMIPDTKNSGVFYIYVKLNVGELKFVNQQQWPGNSLNSTDWGKANGTNNGTAANADNEQNIPVASEGIYRVTFDSKNLKYYIDADKGLMGIVGGGTAADWNPSAVFPNQAMSYLNVNKFISLINLNGGDYKFIDGDGWPNDGNRNRDFGAKTENVMDGKLVEQNESNLKTPNGAGRYRVVFDASNVKDQYYYVSMADEMRVVGEAVDGVPSWTPSASPQMTYKGNGVWEATLSLLANKPYKFLAGNQWDNRLDYEDAGNGKIKWDGGPNFTSPSNAGTYKITLNEYTGTYTVVAQ